MRRTDTPLDYALLAFESAQDVGIDATPEMCYEVLGPEAEGPIPELQPDEYRAYTSWFDFIADHASRRRLVRPSLEGGY